MILTSKHMNEDKLHGQDFGLITVVNLRNALANRRHFSKPGVLERLG